MNQNVYQNKAHQAAVEYFKSIGKWFEGCHMHHIDPTLKERDPERYGKWLIEDLEILTCEEHIKKHHSLGTYDKHMEKLHKNQIGVPIRDDVKEKISDALTDRVFSDEHKQKIRKSLTGKPKTEEHKIHWHESIVANGSLVGGKNPAARQVICVETGVIYDCMKDCFEALNMTYKVFMRHVKKQLAINGFHYVIMEKGAV